MHAQRVAILLIVSWVAPLLVGAAGMEQVFVSTAEGTRIEVQGSSSLHDWHVTTTHVDGSLNLRAVAFAEPWAPTPAAAADDDRRAVHISLSVDSLRSAKSGLNKKMYEALQRETHPVITFELVQAQAQDSDGELVESLAAPCVLAGIGRVTVAGQTAAYEMAIPVRPGTNGTLVMAGTQQLKMTDFGIDPPTAMMGILKTGDSVTVAYEWTVTPSEPTIIP